MSGGTIPYVIQGRDYLLESDCPVAAKLLEAAWPGVSVKLYATMDCGKPMAKGDEGNASIYVRATFTGSSSALGAAGLLADYMLDVPIGKMRQRGRYKVTRHANHFRVNVILYDRFWHDETRMPDEDRIWNAMAIAIAGGIWQPPRAVA